MRRLTRAELALIEGRVEPVLRLYGRRLRDAEGSRRSAQSIMPLIETVLRLGKLPTGSPRLNTMPLSPLQVWVVDVTIALGEWANTDGCGPVSRYIVKERLTQGRNADRSFDSIACDLEREGVALMPNDVADLYAYAVRALDHILTSRHITRDVDMPATERRVYVPSATRDSDVTVTEFVARMRRVPAGAIAAA